MHRPESAQQPLSEHSSAHELVGFYTDSYARSGSDAELYSRWRALGAIGKADHVITLCTAAGMRPTATLEVGCGDGALLSELHQRGFGGRLAGVEISEPAVAIARRRAQIDEVALYDGERLPFQDAGFDLAILSHVLEHVPRPHELLAEAARAARAVVLEVPLEANLSARRVHKRSHASEVGHLHQLDRGAVREIVQRAGLRLAGELEDPLSLDVQRFFAAGTVARASATAKWGVRASLHRAAPAVARRLFTVHYACLCLA